MPAATATRVVFNSLDFVVFACLVFPVYYALRTWPHRLRWLLVASWGFYASWSPRFLVLLIATGLGLQTRGWMDRFLPPEMDADTARAWFGQDFPTTPTAAVLRALRLELLEAGVTVPFVVAPINVARLSAAGLDVDEIERRSLQLRDSIGAQPNEWMETTSLGHPGDFMDILHVKPDVVERFARHVADRLSERLQIPPPDPNS